MRGVLDSGDTRAALASLASLGVPWQKDGDTITVDGRGGDFPVKNGVVPIGSSGTVGRFLPGLLAAAADGDWLLESTPQLAGRPNRDLTDGLRQWGARLDEPADGRSFPLRVRAGGLAGGDATVNALASSQFASGLLMAAPLCRSRSGVVIHRLDPEEAYVDMTLDIMERFGVVPAETKTGDPLSVFFAAPLQYRAADLTIEADANTANYFLALAAVTGGRVAVTNLPASSRQPGRKFLDLYRRLGCAVEEEKGGGVAVAGGPPPLRGGFTVDMRAMSEMALTLGVMAVFADAPVTMTNLSHIRGHESDRIAALAELLRRVGVDAEEKPDAVTVHPKPRSAVGYAVVDPADDHRLAMSAAVLGAAANGIGIANPACVAKTCPAFFAMLERLGVRVLPGA